MKKVCTSILVAALLVVPLNAYTQANEYNKKDSRHRFGFYGGVGKSTITGLDAVNSYGLPDVGYNTQNFSTGYKFMWDIGFSYQYEKKDKYFLQNTTIIFNSIGTKLHGVSKRDGSKITAINARGYLFHFFGGEKKLKQTNI